MKSAMTLDDLNAKISALKTGERMALFDIPESMYHESEGVGSTLLKAATQSMAHYKAKREKLNDFSEAAKKAMLIGRATHCLVLEAELYAEKFVRLPSEIKVRNGKKWEAFRLANAGKDILSESEELMASAMSDEILETVGKYFIGGVSEKSYWYRHESGLVLKARVDYEIGDGGVDLKTTKHDTPEQFKKALKYDYAIQEVSYRLVTGLSDMFYVGIGKGKPYSVFLCKQGKDVRERATQAMEKAIADICEAKAFDSYPNIPVQLMETELTAYELERQAS